MSLRGTGIEEEDLNIEETMTDPYHLTRKKSKIIPKNVRKTFKKIWKWIKYCKNVILNVFHHMFTSFIVVR